ncbi:hypothetical protein V5O48_019390, partial [Marasmius crinis-equi]
MWCKHPASSAPAAQTPTELQPLLKPPLNTTTRRQTGWVITTATEVQHVHPNQWPQYLAAQEQELASKDDTLGGISPAEATPQAVLTQLPAGRHVEEGPLSEASLSSFETDEI